MAAYDDAVAAFDFERDKLLTMLVGVDATQTIEATQRRQEALVAGCVAAHKVLDRGGWSRPATGRAQAG
jgi:hypothetical protein